MVAPVTVPYVRYSIRGAHWWIGRALHALVHAAGLRPRDVDGLCISSFSLGNDTAVGSSGDTGRLRARTAPGCGWSVSPALWTVPSRKGGCPLRA